ncbi:MAG: general secretion pathway protein GspB [Burkholderiaceae bacterium]
MSYILDALRKADAERERGNVPGIHAQPMIGGSAPTATPGTRMPWPWIGAAALAVLLVLAAGWLLTRGETREVAGSRPAPVAAAPVMSPPPMAAPAAAPARVKEEPLPVIRQTLPPAAPTPAAKAVAKPPPAASSVGGAARIPALVELPEEIRRQLPKVGIGASSYSKKAADRILVVNGQVLHEGDQITPDLVLQQIKLRAAVLAFKGLRYEIAY